MRQCCICTTNSWILDGTSCENWSPKGLRFHRKFNHSCTPELPILMPLTYRDKGRILGGQIHRQLKRGGSSRPHIFSHSLRLFKLHSPAVHGRNDDNDDFNFTADLSQFTYYDYSVSQKNPPLGDLTFFHFFHKRLRICN